jgi:signal transduction histidine kinase
VVLCRLGDRVEMRFEDTGIGMTVDEADRVFLPFNSSFGSGTGLGLSIVYQIVTRHRGVIDVASSPGSGSVFTINMPRILDHDEPIEPTDDVRSANRSSRSRFQEATTYEFESQNPGR